MYLLRMKLINSFDKLRNVKYIITVYANIEFIYFVFYCLKSLDETHKNSIRYKQVNCINFAAFIASYIIILLTIIPIMTKFIVVDLNAMLARIG